MPGNWLDIVGKSGHGKPSMAYVKFCDYVSVQ